MRVGLSWDFDRFETAQESYAHVLDEAKQADAMGFHSIWVAEGRERASDCSAPSILLTTAARTTQSVQLRIAGRRVTRGPARACGWRTRRS